MNRSAVLIALDAVFASASCANPEKVKVHVPSFAFSATPSPTSVIGVEELAEQFKK